MSTPAPARPVDAIQSTQKQLDELDALIQRMLTLPVNQLEEEPELPALASVPPRTLQELPEEKASPVPPPPLDTSRQDSAPETPPPLQFPIQAEVFVTAPSWQREEALTSRPASPQREEALTSRPASPITPPRTSKSASPRAAWWLRWLIGTNRVFDRCTLVLGARGRRLRNTRGRAFLGWTGLLLLAAALLWGVLDWIILTW